MSMSISPGMRKLFKAKLSSVYISRHSSNNLPCMHALALQYNHIKLTSGLILMIAYKTS